ncbi:MAG: hypothetical protein HOE90_15945 [Bacteriovoracaceae bacterium]|jgi:hypothetical protein|nr:hypothetical protein [Bacteriovoracaceae bacterium]
MKTKSLILLVLFVFSTHLFASDENQCLQEREQISSLETENGELRSEKEQLTGELFQYREVDRVNKICLPKYQKLNELLKENIKTTLKTMPAQIALSIISAVLNPFGSAMSGVVGIAEIGIELGRLSGSAAFTQLLGRGPSLITMGIVLDRVSRMRKFIEQSYRYKQYREWMKDSSNLTDPEDYRAYIELDRKGLRAARRKDKKGYKLFKKWIKGKLISENESSVLERYRLLEQYDSKKFEKEFKLLFEAERRISKVDADGQFSGNVDIKLDIANIIYENSQSGRLCDGTITNAIRLIIGKHSKQIKVKDGSPFLSQKRNSSYQFPIVFYNESLGFLFTLLK